MISYDVSKFTTDLSVEQAVKQYELFELWQVMSNLKKCSNLVKIDKAVKNGK